MRDPSQPFLFALPADSQAGNFQGAALQLGAPLPGDKLRGGLGEFALGGFGVVECSQGIVALHLDDSRAAVREELCAWFPSEDVDWEQKLRHAALDELRDFLERPEARVPWPLAPRGSEFQRRVWETLTRIPPGGRVSYTELAREMGSPRGARAVASACAKNSIAILIPCHRVVGRNGALSGYRWGLERKRSLLSQERG